MVQSQCTSYMYSNCSTEQIHVHYVFIVHFGLCIVQIIERETALESFLPRSLLGRAHEKPFRRRLEGLLRLRSWMADASTSSTSSAGTGSAGLNLNGSLSRSLTGSGSSVSEQQAPLAFLGLGERELLACVSAHVDFFLAEQPNHLLTSHAASASTSAPTSRLSDGSSKHSQAGANANANEAHAAAILASRVFSEVQVRSSHVYTVMPVKCF